MYEVSNGYDSGETVIFGEEGQIHIGRFEQQPFDVIVEAYGRRGREEPLARRTFSMRRYADTLPEFADRFGPAYKAELAAFVKCCRDGAPFPTTHNDGLRAQQVIEAGMQAVFTRQQASRV